MVRNHSTLWLSLTLTVCGVMASAELTRPQGADPSWSATGNLNTGRSGHSATVLPDGRVLVAGGVGAGGTFLNSAELFDPATGTWSLTGDLPARRAYHVAMVFPNGKVLVVGGLSASNISASVNSAELYDPAAGTWSSNANLIRGDGSATLLPNGKVLVAGSHTADPIVSSSAELYDPATGTSGVTGNLNTGRSLHTATLLPNGKVLVSGGHIHPVEVGLNSAELYDPASGTWSRTGNLNAGRFEHSETLLANGKVLVLGGWVSGFTRLNSAELYDPASGTWSTAGSLNTARTAHTTTLLPNGKILIVGGSLGPPAGTPPLRSAELYDPASGTWSRTADLNIGRSGHTATLLPNGKVVVVGGNTLSSAELYDSGTPPGTWSYTIPDRGGVTIGTAGRSASIEVGYARLQPDPGNYSQSGLAIFGLRQNGVLVSEAGVPASPKIRSGRIYAEASASVNTGLAIANPNNESATVSFYFTDSNGTNLGTGSFTLPANGQIASFLNQTPFSGGSSFSGSFTFESTLPVSVIALRGLNNERSEFLVTTLPVAELSARTEETAMLPHFADGGGWRTQILLVNPTDETETGTVLFLGQGSGGASAQPVAVTVSGQTSSTFPYTIPPRSARRFETSGTTEAVRVGSVRITPSSAQKTPSAVAVFSFRSGGVTVSEAGVPAVGASTAFRIFTESSGEIQSGIAVANVSSDPTTVRFEATNLTGITTGLSGTATIPGNGQVALFLNQIQGLEDLLVPFQGIVRVSTESPAGVSLIALRGRMNERKEFLITTLAPAAENAPTTSEELLFPHFADGGGYTTQFILFNGSPGRWSTGMMRFFGQLGRPFIVIQ